MQKNTLSRRLNVMLLFLRLPIIVFFVLFSSIVICLGSLFACLSYKKISITSPTTIKVIEKCIIYFSKDYKVNFSSLNIEKDEDNFLTLKVSISDLNFKYRTKKETHLDVSKIPVFNFSIPVKNVFSGVFIPSIDLISGVSVNVPVNTASVKDDKKNISEENSDNKIQYISDLHVNVEKLSKTITSIINNSSFSLNKGISIKDIKIDFIDILSMKRVSQIEVKNSKISIIKQNKLKDELHKKLVKKLFNNKQMNNKKTNRKKNRFMNNKKIDINVLMHETELIYNGKKMKFSGICDYNTNKRVNGCVFDVNGFPFKFAKKVQHTNNKINIEASLYGNLFIYFYSNGGLRKLEVNADLTQKKVYLKGKNSKQVKDIKLSISATNNLKKIDDINLLFYNDKKKIITAIQGNDLRLKNGKIVDGNIVFSVNNIHLSDFYEFIDAKFKISNAVKKLDGVIDGRIFFKFNKKGDLLPVGNDASKIYFKKLIINSKTFDYNLSNLVFSMEIIDKNIFLRATAGGDKKRYLLISYNNKKNAFDILVKDFFINKENFAKIKQLFFDATQFNLMKNIEFSTISNGNIRIPIENTLLNTKVNLQINILSTDFEDGIDDEIFITLKKNVGNENCDVLMDFGKSIIHSSLYNFDKKPEDRSIIKAKINLKDSKKENNAVKVDANGKWLFNNKKICDFYMHFDGEIDVGIISKKANFIIKQNGFDYSATVFGDYVHLDYEFWHTMVMLMTMLKTPGVLSIRLDVKDGRIQDVKLDDVDFLIKLQKPYFWGHFDFKMGYQGHTYNMHFVSDGNDNKYDIDIENILPMLTLGDVDITKIPAKTVKITGSGDNFYQQRTLDGKLRIDLTHNGTGVLDFTRVYSIDIDRLVFDKRYAHIENAFVHGKWFDAMLNFDTTYTGDTLLDANVFVYTPLRSIKHWFVEKPSLKDNRGAKIIKRGKTMQEFAKHMTINGKDFSIDKDGKMQASITDVMSEIIKEQKSPVMQNLRD